MTEPEMSNAPAGGRSRLRMARDGLSRNMSSPAFWFLPAGVVTFGRISHDRWLWALIVLGCGIVIEGLFGLIPPPGRPMVLGFDLLGGALSYLITDGLWLWLPVTGLIVCVLLLPTALVLRARSRPRQ